MNARTIAEAWLNIGANTSPEVTQYNAIFKDGRDMIDIGKNTTIRNISELMYWYRF